MTYAQQRELHSCGVIKIPRSHFPNPIPSDTDPTQDVPIKNIQFGINGEPLNVRKQNMANGVSIDEMSSIDRRNTDKFDVLGELQASQRSASKTINDIKQQKNEKEIN